MSDELIAKLRRFSLARSGELRPNPDAVMADAAADELERLRLENVNLRHAIRWACGEAPDGNDQWFSDVMPETKPGERPKPYWWRSHLRKIAGIDHEQSAGEK